MSWHKEWYAIELTITEFTGICGEFIEALSVQSSDTKSTFKKVIRPMAIDIINKITLLKFRYETQLPKTALQKIKKLTEDDVPPVKDNISATDTTPAGVSHLSSMFRKFRAEFNYLTSDLEGIALRLTARAFTHLQRSIIADESIRDKWIEAFKNHETACEKLGSAHLLLHGIWSFKANSEGERTDLILGEPLRDKNLNEVYLTADGLVLTEWKLVKNNSKKKYEEALNQAGLYAKGSLASIELKGYRYLVIVSEDFLRDLPDDIEQEGIVYKYINIAVNPSTPSKQARA